MLKHKRKRKGLSQSQLGRKIRKDKSYVSRMERKIKGYEPDFDLIKKIAKELGCCPIELFVFFADIDCKHFNKRKDS